MNKYIFLIFLLCSVSLIYGAQFSLMKENEFELYYEKTLNPYTVEYAIKLLKHSKEEIVSVFKITNSVNFKIYLYADTINFISEQKGMWWESYLFKTNVVYINNVDFLMEKNCFNIIIKYLVVYRYLLEQFKNKVPGWFLKGISLYFAKLSFPDSGIKFKNFDELLKKLENYTTKEEYQQSHKCLYEGISYLANNFTFDKLIEFINQSKSYQNFENLFFQFFGLQLSNFKEMMLR